MDLYTLTLPLDTAAGAAVRAWLISILDNNAACRQSTREIVLAAAEAVNSAIRNAAPERTTVIVTLSIVGRDVYVRVIDRDRGELQLERERVDICDPAVADELGMSLMHGLMDEVDLHCDGEQTTVRLVKRLRLSASAGEDGGPLEESREAC